MRNSTRQLGKRFSKALQKKKKGKEKGKRKERKTQLLSVRNCMIPLMMPLHDTF